jgi:ABC-type transport system involved in cytochrome c biogenesis permease subunit
LVTGLCFLLSALAYTRPWSIAAWLSGAGALILAGTLVVRGLGIGHWPLTNQYEFALAFALSATLAAMILDRAVGPREPTHNYPTRSPEEASLVQAATLVLASALVLYATFALPDSQRAIQPLQPALDSIWLPLHVGSAALAYGPLALAGAAGLVWLLSRSARSGTARQLHQGIAWGYPLLTLSLIFGMIWAQVTWGRYWGWDLKEVWSLASWLLFTIYFHLHRRRGWRGRGLAWLALLGLCAILFTFLGIGWLARRIGLDCLHLF